MTAIEQIHAQLEALIVQKMPPSPIIERLDELAKRYRNELSGDLAHYLQRRSYQKALDACRSEANVE